MIDKHSCEPYFHEYNNYACFNLNEFIIHMLSETDASLSNVVKFSIFKHKISQHQFMDHMVFICSCNFIFNSYNMSIVSVVFKSSVRGKFMMT